ncbi:lytic transglycosylase catalytic [Providencia rettgeri]|uniref:lytic transglycosylase catalytic n=1 Tax=Providencia rettgeri TaxID=587 RepID=UPI001CFEAD29|nr:lytic transglycosylase catalytic [Providencia rettgeri]EIU7558134.1 lytic transglycosylase catalytic [Providencia rettgeri]MCB4842060.1 lytic transglycosylase catalytic [Providencia rettgeri]
MSNNVETMRDFLVSLGFDVDESGAKKFSSVLGEITSTAFKAGAAVEGAAAVILGFTAQISKGLDDLYWQAQRTGATANSIKSLGYAVKQAGGDINGFNQSVERLGAFLRNTPGGEGFLKNIGVQTRDANGNLRDTASLVALVGDRLSKMPMYRATAFGQALGIDENTLLAMRRGLHGYSSEYTMMMKAIGYNPDLAAKQGNAFMTQFSKLTAAVGIGKDKIGGELARVLTPSIERFTELLVKNFPTIEKIILKIVNAILTLTEILNHLVYRAGKGIRDLIGWWHTLDDSSKGLIKTFGLVLAAWWALNKGFLTSPIGLMIAALTALLLLWDDYQTWKEGGKSAIDWSEWEGTIDSVTESLQKIWEWATGFVDMIGGWENVFWGFALFLGGKWLLSILATLTKVGAGFIRMFGLPGLLIGGAILTFDLMKSKIDEVFDDLEKFNDKVIEKVGNAAVAVYTFKNPNATNEEKAIAFANATNGIIPGTGFIGDMLKLKNGHLSNAWDAVKNSELGKRVSSSGGLSFTGTQTPKGIRNNNPLNLVYAKQRGAYKKEGSIFASFGSAYEGLRANARQLMMYYNGTSQAAGYQKLQTVEDIIKFWAPKSHKGNDTEAYIKRVSDELNVKRNQKLDLNDPDVMHALMRAMSLVENSNQFPYSKELVTAAITGAPDPTIKPSVPINLNAESMNRAASNLGSMGRSGQFVPEYLIRNDTNSSKQVSISPIYNINVTGGQSPHETAALTSESVGRQNQILVRNLENKVG